MRMSMGLQARQLQTQKLAPRMIQSMEILQLPVLALQERIEQEMNENPLLEKRENDPDIPDEPAERENPDAPAEGEQELVLKSDDDSDDFERLLNMDREFPGTFDDGPRVSSGGIQDAADRKHDAMANLVARSEKDMLETKNDDLVLGAADKSGIAMVFTGKRHFKH